MRMLLLVIGAANVCVVLTLAVVWTVDTVRNRKRPPLSRGGPVHGPVSLCETFDPQECVQCRMADEAPLTRLLVGAHGGRH